MFLNLPDLTGKWLQLIREVAPTSRRIALLWDATTGPDQLRAMRSAAQAAMVDLQVVDVRNPDEYGGALKSAMKARPQALILLSSPLIVQASPLIAEFTTKNRLPAISMFRLFAESGGLMAYGPDLLVFLKGAKPGDLPVEQPTKFELVLNRKTASALGPTIPQTLLLRADALIQ